MTRRANVGAEPVRTGVNQLLVFGVPALFARDLLFDSRYLQIPVRTLDCFITSVSGQEGLKLRFARMLAHQICRFDVEREFLLLEILYDRAISTLLVASGDRASTRWSTDGRLGEGIATCDVLGK